MRGQPRGKTRGIIWCIPRFLLDRKSHSLGIDEPPSKKNKGEIGYVLATAKEIRLFVYCVCFRIFVSTMVAMIVCGRVFYASSWFFFCRKPISRISQICDSNSFFRRNFVCIKWTVTKSRNIHRHSRQIHPSVPNTRTIPLFVFSSSGCTTPAWFPLFWHPLI